MPSSPRYIGKMSPVFVDTIALLRSFPVSNVNKIPEYVSVRGYYSVGDVSDIPAFSYFSGYPAGHFVDNGGSVIVPTGGDGSASWVWSYKGEINVLWFGVRPQSGEDQYSKLNYIISSFDSVFIPSGEYEISGTFNLLRAIHNIRGTGNQVGGTILRATAGQTVFAHSTGYWPRLNIRGLYLDFPYTPMGPGLDFPSSGGVGFHFLGVSKWPEFSVIEQVTINGANYGILNNSGTYATAFRNVHINHCRRGVSWTYGTTITFDSVLIGNCQVGWFFSNAIGCTMNSCACDTSNASLNLNDGTWANRFVSCQSFTINSFAAEGNVLSKHDTSFFWLDNCLGFTINGLYMLGTVIDGLDPGAYTEFQFVKVEINSRVTINGWMTETYGGDCSYRNSPDAIYFILSTAGSETKMHGCRLSEMTKLDAGSTPFFYQAHRGKNISEMCEVHSSWVQASLVNFEESYLSAAPTTGPHFVGEKYWNSSPSATGIFGWVCIASGTPGTWLAIGNATDGTYTPTLTNVTNISASTARLCQWIRVGNTVTVSGSINIDVITPSSETAIKISLPIPSNLANTWNVGGGAFSHAEQNVTMSVYGSPGDDFVWFYAPSGWSLSSAIEFSFTFTYRIM